MIIMIEVIMMDSVDDVDSVVDDDSDDDVVDDDDGDNEDTNMVVDCIEYIILYLYT